MLVKPHSGFLFHRKPIPSQYGQGFGNILSTLARYVIPFVRNAFRMGKPYVKKMAKKAMIKGGEKLIRKLSEKSPSQTRKKSMQDIRKAKTEIIQALKKRKLGEVGGPQKKKKRANSVSKKVNDSDLLRIMKKSIFMT